MKKRRHKSMRVKVAVKNSIVMKNTVHGEEWNSVRIRKAFRPHRSAPYAVGQRMSSVLREGISIFLDALFQ